MTLRWRTGLGLPRRSGRHDPLLRPDGGPVPVLHAVSPAVLPRPVDWPPTAQVTGYWFVDAPRVPGDRGLPETAAAGSGEPVVFVGFGSMAGPDPAGTTRMVLDGLRMAGVRGVLATGWGGLGGIPASSDGSFVIGDVPHDVVFPQAAVIVHHGGAGTTAAAVRAGRPQVVCPFVGDQPFWGQRMHQLGVAAEPIAQRRLSAPALATAIRRATCDPAMITAARRLGERVRAESGRAIAVDAVERIAAQQT